VWGKPTMRLTNASFVRLVGFTHPAALANAQFDHPLMPAGFPARRSSYP
jgi:hypothetical protein